MKRTNRSSLHVVTLAALGAFVTTAACKPPPPEKEQESLFDVKGQATASEALTTDAPEDLKAFLYWQAQDEDGNWRPAIDEVVVGGELPASFTLSILDAPSEDEEIPNFPGVAAAMVVVATDDFVNALLSGDTTGITEDTAYGVAQTFVLHVRDEEAAARVLAETRVELPVGFSLIAPNPAYAACESDAYAPVDACYARYSECDSLLGDGSDTSAYDACLAGIDADCQEVQASADEAVGACPPNMQVLASDTEITIALQTIGAFAVD